MFIPKIAEVIPKKGNVKKYILNKNEAIIVVDDKYPVLVELNKEFLPFIKIVKNLEIKLPVIIVDLGAIKFVTNGADIMRPGITQIDDDVIEGKLVLINEEKKNSTIAVGRALYDAIDMRSMTSGKVIRNLHYLTDHWWNFNN